MYVEIFMGILFRKIVKEAGSMKFGSGEDH